MPHTWSSSTNTLAMLEQIAGVGRQKRSPGLLRRLTLAACQIHRLSWAEMSLSCARRSLEQVELYADGRATVEDLERIHKEMLAVPKRDWGKADCRAGKCDLVVYPELAYQVLKFALSGRKRKGPEEKALHAQYAVVLRDVFDAQVCQYKCQCSRSYLEWNGGTVVHLARSMYESQDFSNMPVLGDALEEAGCTDADLLAHCRNGLGHGRGCWVLDLLLGTPADVAIMPGGKVSPYPYT